MQSLNITVKSTGYIKTSYILLLIIKQKAVDRIKTVLRFWFNATRISANDVKNNDVYDVNVHHCYVNEQSETDNKRMILQ